MSLIEIGDVRELRIDLQGWGWRIDWPFRTKVEWPKAGDKVIVQGYGSLGDSRPTIRFMTIDGMIFTAPYVDFVDHTNPLGRTDGEQS